MRLLPAVKRTALLMAPCALFGALVMMHVPSAHAQTTMTTTQQPSNANASAIAQMFGAPSSTSNTGTTTNNGGYSGGNPYASQQYGSNSNLGAMMGNNAQMGNQQMMQYPVPQGFVTPQGVQSFYYPPGMMPGMQQDEISSDEMNALLQNPDSPQYKANKLADKAKREGDVTNFARATVVDPRQTVTDEPTPPELDRLQDVHKTHGTTYNVTDAEIEEELLNLDIRRDAQREAALSYGARGGLAKRQYQVAERLNDFEQVMDGVFNFRALLVRAPSGLLIEPPIVRESLDNILITNDGNEAAVADQILDINKQAKIVAAARDWRNYLTPEYETEITPPPRVLWPKDDKEQMEWNSWVKQGWTAGYNQGEETFETNLNQLVSDYNGMVRYRTLLAEGKISAPYAMHEERGVTGGKNLMRVGDRALRITGPSEFLTGSQEWKPADR